MNKKFRFPMNLQMFAARPFQNIIELRRDLHELLDPAEEMHKKAVAEKRDLTADERRTFDDLIAKADVIRVELRALEDEEEKAMKTEMRAAGGRYGKESDSVVLGQEQRMADLVPATHEERQLSIGKYIKGIVTGDWNGAAAEQRAMSEGVLSAGGYNVPQYLSANIIDLARNVAAVTKAGASVVPMKSNKLTIAKVVGDPTASWKSENVAGTFSDMSFDKIDFNAKTLMALVKVSVELLEDAQNIDTVINNALAEALALELDRAALYGSGVDPQPRGLKLVTGIQTIDLGANGAQLADYSQFSTAVQKIMERNGQPNAALMAARTWGTMDRLKDTTNQPLQPPESYRTLTKLTTNQIPINQTQGTELASSEAFVGAWSNLMIGTRTQIQIEVTRQAGDNTGSAFTQYQVWIRAVLRADIQVGRPEHFVNIKGIKP